MTTKADVLAARAEYERVAETYLREQGWIATGLFDFPWTKPGFTAAGYTLQEAIDMEADREPPA